MTDQPSTDWALGAQVIGADGVPLPVRKYGPLRWLAFWLCWQCGEAARLHGRGPQPDELACPHCGAPENKPDA